MKRRQTRKTRKNRRNRKSHKRGGSRYYYPNNTNPILFTNQSNRQQGGDSRHTFLPNTVMGGLRDLMDSFSSSSAISQGHYPPISSSVLVQKL